MTGDAAPRWWVNTISREHVLRAVEGGFTQAGHGRDTPLRRLRRGDGMVFYSPRTALEGGDPLQEFTALGTITDDAPYQVEVRAGVQHWRRAVAFEQVHAAPIRPLIPRLGFITDEKRWGYPFRRGLFTVSAEDFALIAEAMRVG